MQYWYLMENGAIVGLANFSKGPDWVLSSIPIVDGYDGRFYFAGQEPALSIDVVREAKLADINDKYSAAMGYVQAGYPLDEILSWERQVIQARELLQNPEAEAAFVRGIAAARSIPVEELCSRIIVNASSWEPVAAMLTGLRQTMEDAAFAAKTVEEIQAIKVYYPV